MASREPKVHYCQDYKIGTACSVGPSRGYGIDIKRTNKVDEVTCGACKFTIIYKNAKKRMTGGA